MKELQKILGILDHKIEVYEMLFEKREKSFEPDEAEIII